MDAYHALADPTRRRIIDMLAERPHVAGDIAAEFRISRPAISRHLRVLREAGVVSVAPAAQRRVYSLEPRGLAEVAAWVSRYEASWQDRLDALSTRVATTYNEETP